MCASPLLVLDRPLWYAGERLLPLDQLLRQLGHVLPVALAPPVAQESSRCLRLLKGRALRSPSPRTHRWQVVRLFGSQLLPRVDQRVQEQVAVLETQRHAGFCFLISGFNWTVQLPTQNHPHSPQAPLLLVIAFVKICLSSNLTIFSLLTCTCVYSWSGSNRTRGGFSNHKNAKYTHFTFQRLIYSVHCTVCDLLHSTLYCNTMHCPLLDNWWSARSTVLCKLLCKCNIGAHLLCLGWLR